jgi:two-component system, LytTR family, sensor kinase
MKIRLRYVFYCFLFWSTAVLLDLGGNFFRGMFRETSVNWKEVIPFSTSWFFWFFFTLPVAYLAKRHWYAETSKSRFFAYHLLVFLCVDAVLTVITAEYVTFMLRWLNQQTYTNMIGKMAVSSTFYNFFIYLAIVTIVNIFKYQQDLQSEKNKSLALQKQLTDSRLAFLKQQLQPHFLFNAHHSIITLMKLGEKEKSIEMMEKLSELLRYSLREISNVEITLEKEMELLQLYLDIQKIRFEDKLHVLFDVPSDLQTALVPSMILQPIVENSIKYAVEKTSSRSTIEIKAFRQSGVLCLVVEDKVPDAKNKNTINKGIGLTNTEERLRTLYGHQQELEFDRSGSNGYYGLKVTIKIPLNYV